MTEHIYRYWGETPRYNPTKFDIVGGTEPDVFIYDFDDISDEQNSAGLIIGGDDMIKSASTAEERLLKLFGQFNPKLYKPVIKPKNKRAVRSSKPSKQVRSGKKTKKGDDEILDHCPNNDSSSSADDSSVNDDLEQLVVNDLDDNSAVIDENKIGCIDTVNPLPNTIDFKYFNEEFLGGSEEEDNIDMDDETNAAAEEIYEMNGGNYTKVTEDTTDPDDINNYLI